MQLSCSDFPVTLWLTLLIYLLDNKKQTQTVIDLCVFQLTCIGQSFVLICFCTSSFSCQNPTNFRFYISIFFSVVQPELNAPVEPHEHQYSKCNELKHTALTILSKMICICSRLKSFHCPVVAIFCVSDSRYESRLKADCGKAIAELRPKGSVSLRFSSCEK